MIISWLFKKWYKYHLKKSIKENGIIAPLLVSSDGIILDGNNRFRIAKSLGMETIPVVVLPTPVIDMPINKILPACDI